MSIIPALTATKVIRALKRNGFIEDRQKGSHLILLHPTRKVRTSVPVHAGKTLKRSLVRQIMDDAKLSVEEFLKLL